MRCTALHCTVQVYWCTNNFISLVQSRVVKHPAIKKKLGIGEIIQWKPSDLPMTNFHVSLMNQHYNVIVSIGKLISHTHSVVSVSSCIICVFKKRISPLNAHCQLVFASYFKESKSSVAIQ